jgi:hypothetical protein
LGGAPLAPDQILAKVRAAAVTAQSLGLPPWRLHLDNTHQEVDPDRPLGKKQKDHPGDVRGAGKANVEESAKLLP